MLIVDASCLYDVLVGKPEAERIRTRLAADADQAAPHIIDVEVFSVIRRDFLLGKLDATAATQKSSHTLLRANTRAYSVLGEGERAGLWGLSL